MTVISDYRTVPVLRDASFPEDLEAIVGDSANHTLEVVVGLTDVSDVVAFTHPREGLTVVRAALDVAGRLPARTADWYMAHSRGMAAFASRLRGLGALGDADPVYSTAFLLLRAVPGEHFSERADFSRRVGILRENQGTLGAAMVLANRSRQLFEVTGNRHGIGCALVARGVVQRSLGRIDHAAADYRTALELIDPELGFMYFWAASINLVVALIEGAAEGRDLEQARRQLWAVEALRRYEEGTVPSLTATWVEARLLTRLGQHASAQAKLERVCAGWRGLDMPFEQTVASLDLANCYFEQSLHGEVVRLAGEMFPLFARFRQLPRAYGALTAFHRAAMTGGLRPATIADARAAVVFARVA